MIPDPAGWSGPAALHHYFVCDVFTSEPLAGNQLAVFVDGRSLSSDEMQRVAREMNIAETVFLLPPAGGGDVAMRIFTPAAELPFAGHPVLGTAFVVGQALGAPAVTLETGAGPIPVTLERSGDEIVFGRMQQPVPTVELFDDPDALLHAVGATASELPIEGYRNGPSHVYIALASEDAVRALDPDMAALRRLGVAANCFAGAGRSWKTRVFYPAAGVPEDPATGSAAGPLAVHLARHGRVAFGEEITIRQGEEIGRPSVLYATASGTAERIDAVEVGGSAVIVAEGSLRIRLQRLSG